MTLNLQFFFLSPVEVIKVTTQNLQEVAEWCGGKVATTESRRVPGRQDSYVWVPTPKGTAISWAFPGMFITKRLVRTVKDELRVTYAVFRRDYFEKNYFDSPTEAVNQTWEKGHKTPNTKKKQPSPKDLVAGAHRNPPAVKIVTVNVMVPADTTMEEAIEIVSEGLGKAVVTQEPVVARDGTVAKQDSVPTEDLGGLEHDGGITDMRAYNEAKTENTEEKADHPLPDSVQNTIAAVEEELSADLPEGQAVQLNTDPIIMVPEDELPAGENTLAKMVDEVDARMVGQVGEHRAEVPTSYIKDNDEPERVKLEDHELRAMGLPTSYQEGYKPVYKDEVPTDVELS